MTANGMHTPESLRRDFENYLRVVKGGFEVTDDKGGAHDKNEVYWVGPSADIAKKKR